MGGTSSSSQTQSSTTAPWAAAQPTINNLLGSLNPQIANSGLTSGESGALSQMTQNAAGTSQFNPAINASTSSLLAGGGANNQAGNISNAYQNYQAQQNPLASNTNYDPMSTPGIGAELTGLNNSITQQINGSFAGAGRDGSGANQYALASGLAAGEAPVLTNQYNANVANQQGAASNLYGAGNSTAGLLSGLQQQYVTNQQAGVNQVGTGLQAQNAGASTALNAAVTGQQLPAQTLGLLASIGIPIAGLGSQSTGTGSGTQTESGAQQFGQIAGGVGSLLGKGGLGSLGSLFS
jgi:hypothetical protein